MEYIAALDLGTSKMIAMVASKTNRHKILARAQIESGDSIRRGLIYKTTEASAKIAELIRRLKWEMKQMHLPALMQVYVGIGGQGLHTKACSVEKDLNGNMVNDELLDELRDECQADSDRSFEVIDKVSPEYYLDGQLELQPQGIRCEKLDAHFQIIFGYYSKFKTEVERALGKETVKVADTFVSPIAVAKEVLTERERERGCALIEFGAGLTYLSIYKSGLLRYLVVIPLGGNAITKDICSMDKTEAEAEKLKINEGCVQSGDEANELNAIIDARTDEIVTNIFRQIEISGYGEDLKAGFILTGGASRLKGLDSLLEQRTDKPVRRIEDNPEDSCIRGLLQLGNENCLKEIATKSWGGIWGAAGYLFGDDKVETPKPEKQPKVKGTLMKGIKEKAGAVANKAGAVTDKAAKGLFD